MFKAQEGRNTCVFRRLRRKGQDLGTLHEGNLQKAISEYVRDTVFFYVARKELTKVYFGVCEVYIFGIRSNSIMKL